MSQPPEIPKLPYDSLKDLHSNVALKCGGGDQVDKHTFALMTTYFDMFCMFVRVVVECEGVAWILPWYSIKGLGPALWSESLHPWLWYIHFDQHGLSSSCFGAH